MTYSHSGRTSSTAASVSTQASTVRPGVMSSSPPTTTGTCWPISRKTRPSSSSATSRHTASACSRVAADTIDGDEWLIHSPATTTASTPEACTFSAIRYAANGVASDITVSSSGSSSRR
jgi:hypothetical protein